MNCNGLPIIKRLKCATIPTTHRGRWRGMADVEHSLFHRNLEITVHYAAKHTPKKTIVLIEYYAKWKGYTDDHNDWEQQLGGTYCYIELDVLKGYQANWNHAPSC